MPVIFRRPRTSGMMMIEIRVRGDTPTVPRRFRWSAHVLLRERQVTAAVRKINLAVRVFEERRINSARERRVGCVDAYIGAFRFAGLTFEQTSAQTRGAVSDVKIAFQIMNLRRPHRPARVAVFLRPLLLPRAVAFDAPDQAARVPFFEVA